MESSDTNTVPDAVEIDEKKRNERAMGRWRILRAALLGSSLRHDGECHSIHSFPGYRLSEKTLVNDEKEREFIESMLSFFRHENCDGSATQVCERSLRVLKALSPSRSKARISGFSSIDFAEREHIARELLRKENGLNLLDCKWYVEKEGYWALMAVWDDPSSNSDNPTWQYQIQRYATSPSSQPVYVHERVPSSERKLTLRDLTSHQHQERVDNTGNICVWDCEKTLTWFLQTSQHKAPTTILEVGVGMAGLAALSWYGRVKRIILTDGHQDCIENNEINCCLARVCNPDVSSELSCHMLRWSYDMESSPSIGADWTLVSDCTHFQEWHGELGWTLVWHTAVGGIIWMCQPTRGMSWRRFENLFQQLNYHQGGPLVRIQEESVHLIEEKHNEFAQSDATTYDPDRHRPRIFRIEKLRDCTVGDRDAIIELARGRTDSKEP